MSEVAIIGSGLNGLAVSYLLGKHGIAVSIFEDKQFGGNFKNDLRTSFISHKSVNMFPSIASEIVCKSGNIKNIYSFKNEHSAVVELGNGKESMGYVVDNALLKELFINAVHTFPSVNLLENTTVESVINHNDGVNINGKTFDMAICASGANSSIHKLLGCIQEVKPYNQYAFVFDIAHTKEHKNIAIEAFDECGVVALLPKLDDFKSSVILSLKNDYAEKLGNEQVLDFLRAKTQRVRHVGEIVGIATPIHRHPLCMKYMKHQLCGNVFFVGDAFHAIHPVLGQGFNMSLKDVKKLCDAIAEMKTLGVPLYQGLQSLPVQSLANHITMGIATHVFGKAFVSTNKVTDFLTTTSVYLGGMLPQSFRTKFLQRLL